MQGVVLEIFGQGNAPENRPDLFSVLKEAFELGVVIINITQCAKGCVVASNATGKVSGSLFVFIKISVPYNLRRSLI